jgi:Flp pilus assembly protein TadG
LAAANHPTTRWGFNVFATIREFFRNMNGGVAVMFAGMAPTLLAVLAVAADHVNMGKIREELQVAADAPALAGAKEFRLAGSTDKQIVAIA